MDTIDESHRPNDYPFEDPGTIRVTVSQMERRSLLHVTWERKSTGDYLQAMENRVKSLQLAEARAEKKLGDAKRLVTQRMSALTANPFEVVEIASPIQTAGRRAPAKGQSRTSQRHRSRSSTRLPAARRSKGKSVRPKDLCNKGEKRHGCLTQRHREGQATSTAGPN